MLITDWLQNQEKFTEIDENIANLILKKNTNIKNQSARSLSNELHVAPSTLSRFCKKAGFEGYIDFRERLIEEFEYLRKYPQAINPNLPFNYGDSPNVIAGKIQKLEHDTINATYNFLKDRDLLKLSKFLEPYSTIMLFSVGDPGPLYAFKNKMLKIGKTVIINNTRDGAFYFADMHARDWLFILVSYSGETPVVIRLAKYLKTKKAAVLAITSYGENSLQKQVKHKLYLATGEKLTDNFGSYSIVVSENYLFDYIYSLYFTHNFTKNYHFKVKVAQLFEEGQRDSDNPLLKD
ncbi:MurR/RpiR family transcriptional regulator [Lactobacillus sp. LL6]|uniref:MurR/RpiR family transcriptional regulator n=1 Tax=Lactobacillus sp. LL6 TaxID=2596827 RepID=UPI001185BB25|nr:MurR/RpiR family transcriptional regulator [Lactobacillus sp. LL6]TSO25574.1 MurR/RpiR family transcriptional regulator [Lactobacillus sp. LL6]